MGQSVAVVLAAGQGTRMKSGLPKVLHRIAGKPMIEHVTDALKNAGVKDILVVLGYQGEAVEAVLAGRCAVVYQHEQLGTGHALLQALSYLQRRGEEGLCLVVCGDTPLLQAKTLQSLQEKHCAARAAATVLTAVFDNPAGYGRIIRYENRIERIVEEKDATREERSVKEINTGTYCFEIKELTPYLSRLAANNVQGEYYLTDIIRFMAADGKNIETLLLEEPWEAMGINNRIQLAEAEKHWRRLILERHMLNGVTVIDPDNTYISAGVKIGKDSVVYPGVLMEGDTVIGENCVIGPFSQLISSQVGDNTEIKYSCLLEAKVGPHCSIGPYSFLRPGTNLAEKVKVGDFVEVKNAQVARGSKIPHLSYVGDSVVGENVNIGAGTITCNYDGNKKNITKIGDGAFVGSNTNLVAPITVGAGAYIGAGSTVTEDIPDNALAIARGRQRNIENWKSRSTQGSAKTEK